MKTINTRNELWKGTNIRWIEKRVNKELIKNMGENIIESIGIRLKIHLDEWIEREKNIIGELSNTSDLDSIKRDMLEYNRKRKEIIEKEIQEIRIHAINQMISMGVFEEEIVSTINSVRVTQIEVIAQLNRQAMSFFNQIEEIDKKNKT